MSDDEFARDEEGNPSDEDFEMGMPVEADAPEQEATTPDNSAIPESGITEDDPTSAVSPADTQSDDSGAQEKKGQDKARQFISEMRGLLNNYPTSMGFSSKKDSISMAENVLLIRDMLGFCLYKSLKPEIKEQLQEEIDRMEERLLLKDLRLALNNYLNNQHHFATRMKLLRVESLIRDNIDFIADRIQYYQLAIPVKGKPNMHLRSAQGLPAYQADQYESTEIEAGKAVQKGDPFKVGDDGEIIPLD